MTSIVISARLLSSDAAKPKEQPFELRDSRLNGFILRVQPSGVRTYIVQLERGKRVTIGRAGQYTPDEARERAEKALGNFAHGRPALQGIAGTGASGKTLREFIGEPSDGKPPADGSWLLWAKAKRRKTWRGTLGAVKLHFATLLDTPLTAITSEAIEDLMTKRLAAGSPASSVRRDGDALAGMLTQAVKRKLLAASPMKGVEKPQLDRNPKVRYLTVDELRRLRAALDERDAKMIAARENANRSRGYKNRPKLPELLHFGDHLTVAVLLSMLTGMRLGELLRLRWSDISSDVITLEETKGVDTRHQPMIPEVKQLLRKWREQCKPSADDYVLPVRDNMKRAWRALLQRAKITKFRWHDLRHTYASVIMQEGGNLNHVRELLGHKEIRTTLRYAHLGQDDKAAAAGLWSNRLKRVASKKAKRQGQT